MSQNWIDRARQWMRESGTSQGSLARALDCTRGAVGHYLAGRRQPTLTQMERIAGVMEVHPAWLLYGIGHEHVKEEKPAFPSAPTATPAFTLRVVGGGSSRRPTRPPGQLNLHALAERCYGFQVEPGGSSARAHEGEILVVDPQSVPQPGDEVLVGFADSATVLYELVSIQGDRLTLDSLTDPRRRRECRPRELTFMHRIIAVVRRGGLPMTDAEVE